MACMEHRCTRCEWSACDNERRRYLCPKCGSRVISTFDEPREREAPDWRDAIGEYPDPEEDDE